MNKWYKVFRILDTKEKEIIAIEKDYKEVEEWLIAFMSNALDIDYEEITEEEAKELIKQREEINN